MDYLILVLKAMASILLNPVFYWIIIISLLPSDNRIKLEESVFNYKMLPLGTELKNTLKPSLLITILMLIFTIGFKVTFPYEALIILSVILILLSYKMKYIFLSASYSLGLTYIILWFLPKGSLENALYTEWTFISITIMISLLLFGEAILLLTFRNSEAGPKLAYSKRGRWYGILQMKKLSIIPFLVFLPEGEGILTNSLIPSFSIANESYTIFIMPFAIGFNHLFRGNLPEKYSKNIGFSVLLLALIVLFLSLASFKLTTLSLLAAIIAIVGRGLIHYSFYKRDLKRNPYFLEGQEQLRILGVIPASLAEKYGFQTGDSISTFNGEKITSVEQLDKLLKKTQGDSLMEISRKRSRLRFIEIRNFTGSSLELGLIFAMKPIQANKSTARE